MQGQGRWDIHYLRMGLKLAGLLTTSHKSVFRFNVTAPVNINCARSYLCQARQLSLHGIRAEKVNYPRIHCQFISQLWTEEALQGQSAVTFFHVQYFSNSLN